MFWKPCWAGGETADPQEGEEEEGKEDDEIVEAEGKGNTPEDVE